jgi:WD40 repeat protein
VLTSDDSFIFSASRDNTIRCWSTHTGQLIHTFVDHETGVNSLCLSNDENILCSAGTMDGLRSLLVSDCYHNSNVTTEANQCI